jgi:hypothetical protein
LNVVGRGELMSNYIVGLDLGQANDYTALCIIEKLQREDGAVYHIRKLERTRGTPYPEIISKVTRVMQSPELVGSTLIVDQTGVGAPVVDSFRQSGLKPIGIMIHGGDGVTHDGNTWRVPKRDLVSCLQVLNQNHRLKTPLKLVLSRILTGELLNFRVKIDPATAHDSYSAWRDQDHDDLVLAVALACWWGEHQPTPIAFSIPKQAIKFGPFGDYPRRHGDPVRR